jgi:phage terminase small subunit
MSDIGEFGPKLAALPKRMQLFVLALLQQGNRNFAAAAKAAGYSGKSRNYLRVAGCRLAHDERVQAAIQEEARRQLHALMPMANETVASLMENSEVDPAVRLRAAISIQDRAGLHAVTEQRVTHNLGDDPQELQQMKLLAESMGVPLEKLIGHRLAAQAQRSVTNAEYIELPTVSVAAPLSKD